MEKAKTLFVTISNVTSAISDIDHRIVQNVFEPLMDRLYQGHSYIHKHAAFLHQHSVHNQPFDDLVVGGFVEGFMSEWLLGMLLG